MSLRGTSLPLWVRWHGSLLLDASEMPRVWADSEIRAVLGGAVDARSCVGGGGHAAGPDSDVDSPVGGWKGLHNAKDAAATTSGRGMLGGLPVPQLLPLCRPRVPQTAAPSVGTVAAAPSTPAGLWACDCGRHDGNGGICLRAASRPRLNRSMVHDRCVLCVYMATLSGGAYLLRATQETALPTRLSYAPSGVPPPILTHPHWACPSLPTLLAAADLFVDSFNRHCLGLNSLVSHPAQERQRFLLQRGKWWWLRSSRKRAAVRRAWSATSGRPRRSRFPAPGHSSMAAASLPPSVRRGEQRRLRGRRLPGMFP